LIYSSPQGGLAMNVLKPKLLFLLLALGCSPVTPSGYKKKFLKKETVETIPSTSITLTTSIPETIQNAELTTSYKIILDEQSEEKTDTKEPPELKTPLYTYEIPIESTKLFKENGSVLVFLHEMQDFPKDKTTKHIHLDFKIKDIINNETEPLFEFTSIQFVEPNRVSISKGSYSIELKKPSLSGDPALDTDPKNLRNIFLEQVTAIKLSFYSESLLAK